MKFKICLAVGGLLVSSPAFAVDTPTPNGIEVISNLGTVWSYPNARHLIDIAAQNGHPASFMLMDGSSNVIGYFPDTWVFEVHFIPAP